MLRPILARETCEAREERVERVEIQVFGSLLLFRGGGKHDVSVGVNVAITHSGKLSPSALKTRLLMSCCWHPAQTIQKLGQFSLPLFVVSGQLSHDIKHRVEEPVAKLPGNLSSEDDHFVVPSNICLKLKE